MSIRITADVGIPGRGDPVRGAVLDLDDSQITYFGAAATAPPAPAECEHFDAPVVMPGLWDCHAHYLGLDILNLQRMAVTSLVVSAARSVADAQRTLMGGVTSVRDVGGNGLHLAAAIKEGSIPGPTIYGAGGILSATGGHGDIHSLPLDWVNQIAGLNGLGLICDGIPEVLRAVRTNLRSNAKLIKVCASGGVSSEVDDPIHQQFSPGELAAIVAEAAQAERIVAAHCHGKPGIMAALEAGVHTIEHGSYLDAEAADLMRDNDAILVPTCFVIEELMAKLDEQPPYVQEKALQIVRHHENAMSVAISNGVRIAAGCDIFLSGDSYGRNGREIALLIEAGMSDLDAIESATALAPETLGPQAPMSGRLEAGYDADVIILDTDPLQDRAVWGDPERVTHVWKSGHLEKAPSPG
jgi:imidazolonepropionase-like amidohydrolase